MYTLKLQNDCYYVGWSAAVDTRIAQHFLGNGSKWTTLHRPVRVLSVVPGDKLMENATTIALMCEHGWECVRGGPYCQAHLDGPPRPIKTAMRLGEPANEAATPQESECEGADETITIVRNKPDSTAHAWRAEVCNGKAATECPKRRYKCVYASNLQELARKIDDWRGARLAPAEFSHTPVPTPCSAPAMP